MSIDTDLPDLSLNPRARITVRRMGREMQPLVIVDDVLIKPDDLARYAQTSGNFTAPSSKSYYPGLNGTLPPGYGQALCAALRPLLERAFGMPRGVRLHHEGFFGIACTPPEQLQPLQTIPHFDAADPFRIACVHYLCRPPYKGTAFYRHVATGFESIHGMRVEPYRAAVFDELEAADVAQRGHVIDGDMPGYQYIDSVDAAYNRLAVYRATSLHAGILGTTELGREPHDGRLTANSFIEVMRKPA